MNPGHAGSPGKPTVSKSTPYVPGIACPIEKTPLVSRWLDRFETGVPSIVAVRLTGVWHY